MTRIPRWLAVATTCSVLVAACGGDDENAAVSEGREEETTTTEAETTTSTDDVSSPSEGAAPGGGTPEGTRLAIGETANVPIDDADAESVIAVTVDSIDAGTPEDLAQLDVQGGETGDLYYVNVTIKNVSAAQDAGSYVPGLSDLYAMQEDGQPANPVAEFSTFEPCENEDPSELAVGQSFATCLIFLATSGVAVTSVEYAAAFDADPIVWG